jgi:anti-sigma factor RsiW
LDEKALEGGGFPLIPCSKRDWAAYIEQQLDANVTKEYEEHLYTCDACLQLYMGAVDASSQLTVMNTTQAITEHIMAEIQPAKVETQAKRSATIVTINPKKKQLPLTRRPLFQYGVAAVITLVLMSAGAFQGLSMTISHIESTTHKDQQESYSQKLMEKTVSMLDTIQTQPKGGRNP